VYYYRIYSVPFQQDFSIHTPETIIIQQDIRADLYRIDAKMVRSPAVFSMLYSTVIVKGFQLFHPHHLPLVRLAWHRSFSDDEHETAGPAASSAGMPMRFTAPQRTLDQVEMTRDALSMVHQAIHSVDPGEAIQRHLRMDIKSGRLHIAPGSEACPRGSFSATGFDNVILIAFG